MHPAWCMAEGVGFEPTSPFREAVFKTAALNHSAIPPHLNCSYNPNFYRPAAEGVGCARSMNSASPDGVGVAEPTSPFRESRFRRDALNHSAIPPHLNCLCSPHYCRPSAEGVGCARSMSPASPDAVGVAEPFRFRGRVLIPSCRSLFHIMAEREGFEPSIPFCRILA